MVTVPAAPAALVRAPAAALMAPVLNWKLSSPSRVVSLVIGTRSNSEVLPAARVTPEAADTQLLPL